MGHKAADAKKGRGEKKPHGRPKVEKRSAEKGGSTKKRAKRGGETYKRYIHKVLKDIHPECGISARAMAIMNSFITDTFEKLANEAARLVKYNKKQTSGDREIHGVVRLLLVWKLVKIAGSEGKRAVDKFTGA